VLLEVMTFDVLTAVMLMLIIWVITPCGLADTNILDEHTTSIFSMLVWLLGMGQFTYNVGVVLGFDSV
jgi:hypothetical protein